MANPHTHYPNTQPGSAHTASTFKVIHCSVLFFNDWFELFDGVSTLGPEIPDRIPELSPLLVVEFPRLAAHRALLVGLRVEPLDDAVHVEAVRAGSPH